MIQECLVIKWITPTIYKLQVKNVFIICLKKERI